MGRKGEVVVRCRGFERRRWWWDGSFGRTRRCEGRCWRVALAVLADEPSRSIRTACAAGVSGDAAVVAVAVAEDDDDEDASRCRRLLAWDWTCWVLARFLFSFSFVLVRLLMGFGGCEKEEEEGCAMESLRNARGGLGWRGHSGSLWCVMQFVCSRPLGMGGQERWAARRKEAC